MPCHIASPPCHTAPYHGLPNIMLPKQCYIKPHSTALSLEYNTCAQQTRLSQHSIQDHYNNHTISQKAHAIFQWANTNTICVTTHCKLDTSNISYDWSFHMEPWARVIEYTAAQEECYWQKIGGCQTQLSLLPPSSHKWNAHACLLVENFIQL